MRLLDQIMEQKKYTFMKKLEEFDYSLEFS